MVKCRRKLNKNLTHYASLYIAKNLFLLRRWRSGLEHSWFSNPSCDRPRSLKQIGVSVTGPRR